MTYCQNGGCTANAVKIVEALSGKRVPPELVELAERLRCICNPVVIDIGSGKGYKLLLLALSIHKPCMLVGVELHQGRAKSSRMLLERFDLSPWVEIIVADAHNLPIRDNVAHASILWNVLMFVTDDYRVVSEAWRVTREAGLALISTYRVKRALRNYEFADVYSLVSSKFHILTAERLSNNQVKIVAVKTLHYIELIVEMDKLNSLVEKVETLARILGVKPASKHAVIRIPVFIDLYKAVRDSAKRVPVIVARRTNVVSLALLHEASNPLDYLKKAVEKLYESGCVLSSNKVIEVLAPVAGSKAYAEKLANDLVRLGIITHCYYHRPPRQLCSFIPSIRALRYVRLTITPKEVYNREGLSYALLYNPILHRVVTEAEENVVKAAHIAVRLVREYWHRCYGYNIETIESKRLQDLSFFEKRVLVPLRKLGLVSTSNLFKENTMKAALVERAAYIRDKLERLS